MIRRLLLKLARAAVEGIMQKVMAQVNIMDDLIENTIKGYLSQVTSGAWEGEDADAFVDEVTQVISNIGVPCIGRIRYINTSLQQAQDIVSQADKKVSDLVGNLADKFASIF